jgi:hypothetical protein
MSKNPKVPYLLIAFTFGVVGISGLANGRSGMLVFVIIAGIFVWLGINAGKTPPDSHRPR